MNHAQLIGYILSLSEEDLDKIIAHLPEWFEEHCTPSPADPPGCS